MLIDYYAILYIQSVWNYQYYIYTYYIWVMGSMLISEFRPIIYKIRYIKRLIYLQ